MCRINFWRKKERKKEKKNNKNNNNKKRSKHNMSPKLCLGDIISKSSSADLGGLKKIKMAAVAKVQNGCQMQKSSNLGEIWFPSRL
jgi:hypothetical protein